MIYKLDRLASMKKMKTLFDLERGVDSMGKLIIITLDSAEEHIIEQIENMLVGQFHFIHSEFPAKPVLSYPPLKIDLYQYRVYIAGKEIELTRTEFEILSQLASRPGMVFTYEQLYSMIWNNGTVGNENKLLSYHIRRLRQKLNSAKPKIRITTVREVGYRFDTFTA